MSTMLRTPAMLLSLKIVCGRTGLTCRAVRLYEERGLVQVNRDRNGRRRYDEAMVERLTFIRLCRQAGLKLSEIGELLTSRDLAGASEMAALARTYYRARLADLEAQRLALEVGAKALGLELDEPGSRLMAL